MTWKASSLSPSTRPRTRNRKASIRMVTGLAWTSVTTLPNSLEEASKFSRNLIRAPLSALTSSLRQPSKLSLAWNWATTPLRVQQRGWKLRWSRRQRQSKLKLMKLLLTKLMKIWNCWWRTVWTTILNKQPKLRVMTGLPTRLLSLMTRLLTSNRSRGSSNGRM